MHLHESKVVVLALVQLYFSYSVASNKPYVLIAQARAEFWTAIGRVLTYLIAMAGALGAIPMNVAAVAMIMNQFLMLSQAIFTQMYPMYRSAFVWCYQKAQLGVMVVLLCISSRRNRHRSRVASTDEHGEIEAGRAQRLQMKDSNETKESRTDPAPKRSKRRYVEESEVTVISVEAMQTPKKKGTSNRKSTGYISPHWRSSGKELLSRSNDGGGTGKKSSTRGREFHGKPTQRARDSTMNSRAAGGGVVTPGKKKAASAGQSKLQTGDPQVHGKLGEDTSKRIGRGEGRHTTAMRTPIGRSLDAPLTPRNYPRRSQRRIDDF